MDRGNVKLEAISVERFNANGYQLWHFSDSLIKIPVAALMSPYPVKSAGTFSEFSCPLFENGEIGSLNMLGSYVRSISKTIVVPLELPIDKYYYINKYITWDKSHGNVGIITPNITLP